MARKAWNELSPTYQKRLQKAGVGPAQHAAGASIKGARGHRATPEHRIWRKKAIALDIKKVVPGFDKLRPTEAEKIGRDWVKGFMSRAAGPLEPVKMTDWRYGKPGFTPGTKLRYQTDEQKNAHIEFLAWSEAQENAAYLQEEGEGETNWAAYRAAYQQKFSKG